jgi:Flp pilus assembly pilin Flp
VKKIRNQRGAALIEFALVFPMLFLTLIATLSLLWLLAARSTISGAARDGARFASIRHDPLSCPLGQPMDNPTVTLPPPWFPEPGDCNDYPTEAQVKAYVEHRAGRFGVDEVTLVRPTAPNAPVTVTVTRELPLIFRPVASLFDDNNDFVTVAKVRAE